MAEQPGQIQESMTQRISTNKPIRNGNHLSIEQSKVVTLIFFLLLQQ